MKQSTESWQEVYNGQDASALEREHYVAVKKGRSDQRRDGHRSPDGNSLNNMGRRTPGADVGDLSGEEIKTDNEVQKKRAVQDGAGERN